MRVTVDLSWENANESDVAGYKLSWSGGKQSEKVLTLLVGTRMITLHIALKPKVLYTFAISAYDAAGNESAKRVLKAVYCEA